MSVPEVMWRCRTCGKWSHAKRRPLRHKRFFGDEFDLDHGQERFVAEYNHVREHDTGAPYDVVWLWCGPFDRYEALHSDAYSPPALDPTKLPTPIAHDGSDIVRDDEPGEVPF